MHCSEVSVDSQLLSVIFDDVSTLTKLQANLRMNDRDSYREKVLVKISKFN